MRIFPVLVVSLLALAAPLMAQPKATQLWKARGLEAMERIDAIDKRIDQLRDRWDSPETNEVKCEGMLESAFALHVAEPDIVHKVLDGGKHAFKIVLNGGEQGHFELMYFYDEEQRRLLQTVVLALPNGWELWLPSGDDEGAGAIALSIRKPDVWPPTCVMGFSRHEPFWAYVLPSDGSRQPPKPPTRKAPRK